MVDCNVAGEVVETNPATRNCDPLRPSGVGRFRAREGATNASSAVEAHPDLGDVSQSGEVLAKLLVEDVAADLARAEDFTKQDVA